MERKGIIYVLSAPSGSGKSSLCNEVINSIPNLKRGISYTTRPPRKIETNGIDYYYIKENEFLDMVDRGEFIEWAEVHGYKYGTRENWLRKTILSGIDIILTIDVQGARVVRDKFPDSVLIFLMPPSIVDLELRLRLRGDPEDQIKYRIANSFSEFKQIIWYNYIIINNNFKNAVKELKSIIVAERCKRDRVYSEIKNMIEK